MNDRSQENPSHDDLASDPAGATFFVKCPDLCGHSIGFRTKPVPLNDYEWPTITCLGCKHNVKLATAFCLNSKCRKLLRQRTCDATICEGEDTFAADSLRVSSETIAFIAHPWSAHSSEQLREKDMEGTCARSDGPVAHSQAEQNITSTSPDSVQMSQPSRRALSDPKDPISQGVPLPTSSAATCAHPSGRKPLSNLSDVG